MGQLTPGATYIYEKADGITYAREFGSSKRSIVGWDYDRQVQDELELWRAIVRAGKDNPALQKVLERAILVYKLSKEKLDGK